MIHHAQTQCSLSFPGTCACQLINEIQAALLLEDAVSGQSEVGVSMHDHIAHYILGIGSEGYQQNVCFWVSPKIVSLSSPFALVDFLILLLQSNNLLLLGDG